MSAQRFTTSQDIPYRWPHIARFLQVNNSTGSIKDDYLRFSHIEDRLAPPERAATYEEWADFYEWRLKQRADEFTTDHARHLVAEWTDSMTYSLKRSAAIARGEDPGPWTPQPERRPDLEAERQAIVAEIVAELATQPAMTG